MQATRRTFLGTIAAAAAWPPNWTAANRGSAAGTVGADLTSVPIRIATTKQLFLDDYIISGSQNVQRRLHRPTRHPGNPLVRVDQPWEKGGSGVDLTGGTIFFDTEEQQFKMWYRTNYSILEKAPHSGFQIATGGAYISCYASSEDGVAWQKPRLGLTEFRGSRENNILPPGKGGRDFIRRPNLIKDYEEPVPPKRYKMAYLDEIGEEFALITAYSPDGIHWQMNADPPTFFRRPVIPNGILFGWDPRCGKYVHYHRSFKMVPAGVDGRLVRWDMRRVMRSASSDFKTWSETETALELGPGDPDDLDVGHLGILAGVLYTGDLYVGFLDTCAVHGVEDVPEALWESFYKMDHAEHRQELVMSRDGKSWSRVSPHWEAFRPGMPGSWDADHVILSKPLVLHDKVWIYYSGSNLSCKSYMPDSPEHSKMQYDGIGLATMRLDGFASMESYEHEGWLQTKALVFEGNRLVINAQAPRQPFRNTGNQEFVFTGDRLTIRPGTAPQSQTGRVTESFGRLRVAVERPDGTPIEGFTASDCDTFCGDDVRHAVSWKGKSDLSEFAGKPVRLRFELRNAALYAFQFLGRDGPAESFDAACPGSRGRARRPTTADKER